MNFPFIQPTPEQVEQWKAIYERRQMENEEFQHGFQRMLDEMPLEHLRLFKQVLSMTCGEEHQTTLIEGMVLAAMKYRFGICMSHGTNHDEEFATMERDQEQQTTTPTEPVDIPIPGLEFAGLDQEEVYLLSEDEVRLMKQYHLDDLRDEDTNKLLGFMCTGIEGSRGSCGHVYVSIADRMLRQPEECSACFVKQATG